LVWTNFCCSLPDGDDELNDLLKQPSFFLKSVHFWAILCKPNVQEILVQIHWGLETKVHHEAHLVFLIYLKFFGEKDLLNGAA